MGNCGIDQDSAGFSLSPIFGTFNLGLLNTLYNNVFNYLANLPVDIPYAKNNHITCPEFYISSFTNKFPAIENQCCLSKRRANPVPIDFNMGHMQTNKRYDQIFLTHFLYYNLIFYFRAMQNVTLFANTYTYYPYHVPAPNETITKSRCFN